MPASALQLRLAAPPLPAALCGGNKNNGLPSFMLKPLRASERSTQPKMQFHDDERGPGGPSFWGPAKVGEPHRVLEGRKDAYVLIFNPGRHNEGVYTLQGPSSRAMTGPSTYVLAFEHTNDADRFARQLQAQGFDAATPLRWRAYELAAFCEGDGYQVSLVPAGTMIEPPPKFETPRNSASPHMDRFGDDFNRFDNHFGNHHIDVDRNMQPAQSFDDPTRNYPGLDPSRPDAYAKERSRLEALLPQMPDNCKADGEDDDCLYNAD